jgi:tripartite-type tricarboxylate transporter receptor subunit TctC
MGSSATVHSAAGRRGRTRRAAWISAAAFMLGLFAGGLSASAAHAEDNLNRPVRIIVGAGAGGSLDIQVRIIAPALAKLLGQEVIIEDRPGGGGVIAGQVVATSPPDGNTLFAYANDLFSVAALMPRMTFDPNKQLVAISQIAESPLVVVTGGHSKFSDVKGLIAAANSSPQGLTYATFAVASINNVVGQWIAQAAHIKLVNVTYHSGAEAALAAAAGDVSLAIASPASVYPAMVNAGTVKVIGVTSAQPTSSLPASWPTFAESGLPIDSVTCFGIFGPAGMSAAAIARIDHALGAVLDDDAVRERLLHVGIFAKHLDAADFAKRIAMDKNRYDSVIQAMHMVDAQR